MQTLEILESQYHQIEKELKELMTKNDPSQIFKHDIRGKLFAIEGILRLHLKAHKDFKKKTMKKIEKVLLQTKEVEDELGAFSLVYEIGEYHSSTLGHSGVDGINEDINEDKIKAYGKIIIGLEKYSKRITKHRHTLAKIDWPKVEKFVPKAMGKEIERINSKITEDLKPLIEAKEYGYEELEEGFHEFRRAIRWVSIYIQSYKEIFYLGKLPKKQNAEEKQLVSEFKNSPFAKLGKKGSVEIDALAYYELSSFIKRVGKIKTFGEMQYYLQERYEVSPRQEVKIEPLAHKIYKEFNESKVLDKLIV